MDIINFNKDNIIRKIGEGVESVVYLYNDNGSLVALKKFDTSIEPYTSYDNKELKIIILQKESSLKNDIKVLKRVYYMGKFIGYTSLYEPFDPISMIASKKEKFKILDSIQERYEELNKRDIYIGDFNENNFCMTKNGIKLYDIDNYKIGPLDFNVTNCVMAEYMRKCKNMKNIDYYCFNYFALSYLTNFTVHMVLRGIGNPSFPKKLRTKEIISFIKSLEQINDDTIIERNKDGRQKTLLNLLK